MIIAALSFLAASAGLVQTAPAAVAQTGQLMSPMLKESSQAGLAKTKTALKIEKKLLNKLKN